MNEHTNLDVNASYGLTKEVSEELSALNYSFLNPSSVHSGGQKARAAIEEAREEVRLLLNVPGDARIVFTSGATEANNFALMLPFWSELKVGASSTKSDLALLVTAIEHHSVLETAERIKGFGVELLTAHPESSGEFLEDSLIETVSGKNVVLASLMTANNETGQILDVASLAKGLREVSPGILVHTDAVQAIGKIPLNFEDLNADMLSFSGHKIGGLTGTGVLVARESLGAHSLIVGGPQETRWRAGTENVLGIISLGIAARYLRENLDQHISKLKKNSEYIRNYLEANLKDVRLNLPESLPSLPNTLSMHFAGVRADDLVVALDLEGVLLSSGAACASGKPEPSHVLLAMGYSDTVARESVRISVKADYNEGELEGACEKIVACAERMRTGKPSRAA